MESEEQLFNKRLDLERWLWSLFNQLRGRYEFSVYKFAFLQLFFYKYLCDNPELFQVPKDGLFAKLQSEATEELTQRLRKVWIHIEQLNEPKLNGIFTMIDQHTFSTNTQDDELFKTIMDGLLNFSLAVGSETNPAYTVSIPDVFVSLIENMADVEGRMIGEGLTPSSIRILISNLIEVLDADILSLYDPTCGTGTLLADVAGQLRLYRTAADSLMIYGQELNHQSAVIAKMNAVLHGYQANHIYLGNTIYEPQLLENGRLKQFDMIVSHPPFSVSNWGENIAANDRYDRFTFGIPPKTRGDYAFIQHVLASLRPTGKGVVVIPQGVLFREGSEGRIRQHILEANWIDAVISLPGNMLYNTSIPCALLIFDKGRSVSNKHILMVDASKAFIKGVHNYLTTDGIAGIIEIYETYRAGKKITPIDDAIIYQKVSLTEVGAQDYNLNIARYLTNGQVAEVLDEKDLQQQITSLETQLKAIEQDIMNYSKKLGL